jgi:hypothetical protein
MAAAYVVIPVKSVGKLKRIYSLFFVISNDMLVKEPREIGTKQGFTDLLMQLRKQKIVNYVYH